ncbi:hypothetical protein BTUL_0124g00280 [Botrytis tulipae]|uniref:Uncharacterized protein n=1 Tax=Botrytis tulipae TaxID=87230 RepID=A0A4Z1EES2_9HELO|nr:hypothetical protein BTUL_0124g00280 [Botrytis tulipae]
MSATLLGHELGHWEGFNQDLLPTLMDIAPLANLSNRRLTQWFDSQQGRIPRLLTIYWGTIFLKSTDPRDYIYALLGLPYLEKYRSLIRPSYTKSTPQVFSEAARIMIEEENSLKPIADACSLYCPDASLPSWVPDWAAESMKFFPFSYRESVIHSTDLVPEFRHLGRKTTGPVKDISDFVDFSADGKILSVIGLLHDEVSCLIGFIQSAQAPKHIIKVPQVENNLLPNGLTFLEAMFRIFVTLDIDISLDTYRREDNPRFILAVYSFLKMMVEERYQKSTCRSVFGYDLQEIIRLVEDNPVAHRKMSIFYKEAYALISYRFFFQTKNGTLGLGPFGMVPGDEIYHLVGHNEDYILRKFGDHYRVIGDTRIVRAELPPYSDGGYETIEIH